MRTYFTDEASCDIIQVDSTKTWRVLPENVMEPIKCTVD